MLTEGVGSRQQVPLFRVFVSSPGDVAEERAHTLELLEQLGRRPTFRGRVSIEPVLWDDPAAPTPARADESIQRSIDRYKTMPSACDLVVVILGGRLGTPPQATRADGHRYESGTEYEFETARAAHVPILVYHRTDKRTVDLEDPALDDKREQYRKLGAFLARIRGQDGVRGSVNACSSLKAFASSLEDHLEAVLWDWLQARERVIPAAAIDAGPPLDQRLVSPHSTNRLVYGARSSPFVGRDRELGELRAFFDDPAPLLWWSITGPGGIGKSRLAQEAGLALAEEWHWGFFAGKPFGSAPPFDWQSWQPSAPTYVIVDYAGRGALDVRRLLLELWENRKKLRNKVRVLALERNAGARWWTDLIAGGVGAENIRVREIAFDPISADGSISRQPTSLPLAPLGAEAHWEILKQICDERGMPPPERSEWLATLERTKLGGRPLYVIMSALATVSGREPRTWRVEDLLDWETKERERMWTREFGDVRRCDVELLFVATLAGGIDLTSPGGRQLLVEVLAENGLGTSDYAPAALEFMAGLEASARVPPLEPDILGGHFVLSQFASNELVSARMLQLLDKAWRHHPVATCASLDRLTDDFTAHPALYKPLGFVPRAEDTEARCLWAIAASYAIVKSSAGRGLGSSVLDRLYAEISSVTEASGSEPLFREILENLTPIARYGNWRVRDIPRAERPAPVPVVPTSSPEPAIPIAVIEPPTHELLALMLRDDVLLPQERLRCTAAEAAPHRSRGGDQATLIVVLPPNDRAHPTAGPAAPGTLATLAWLQPPSVGETQRPQLEGICRVRIKTWRAGGEWVSVERAPEEGADDAEALTLARGLGRLAPNVVPKRHRGVGRLLESASAPGVICDLVALALDLAPAEKRELLEATDVRRRVQRVFELAANAWRVELPAWATPSGDDELAELPSVMPVLAIRNAVLFPGAVAPFDAVRRKSVASVESLELASAPGIVSDAVEPKLKLLDFIIVIVQRRPETEDPGLADLWPLGTIARVLRRQKHSNGSYSLILQGLARVSILGLASTEPFLSCTFERLTTRCPDSAKGAILGEALRSQALEMIALMPEIPREAISLIESASLAELADMVGRRHVPYRWPMVLGARPDASRGNSPWLAER